MVTAYPKQKPFRSKKARDWFRGQPCVTCESTETTGHHEPLNGRGTGTKGPDDEQVPMCFWCHRARHDYGRDSWWKIHGIDWRRLVLKWKQKVNASITPGWDDK